MYDFKEQIYHTCWTTREHPGRSPLASDQCCTSQQHAPWLHRKQLVLIRTTEPITRRSRRNKFRYPKQHTVNPLEHGEHRLMVVVVEEPNPRILVILLERHCENQVADWVSSPTHEQPHRSTPQSRSSVTTTDSNGSNYIYIHIRSREKKP